MTDSIYSVSGNKLKTLLITSDSLQFSSSSFDSADDFKTSFVKKISLATKVEIQYSSIKSVKKEVTDNTISIKYKGSVGISSTCEFSFDNESEAESFLSYLEKELYYVRTEEKMIPIKAARPYIIGLLITIPVTIFAHFQALAIANGTFEESSSRRTRMFNNIIEMIGDKGVIAIGILVSAYIIYMIWKRATNPPILITLMPQ